MTVDSQPIDPSDDVHGIQMDFVSRGSSSSMGTAEKINMILDRVADDAVIILEEGLTPDEKSKLVERTMTRTDGKDFTGIEMESFQRGPENSGGFLSRLVDRDPESELMVIGPANKVHTLDKDESFLRALVQSP